MTDPLNLEDRPMTPTTEEYLEHLRENALLHMESIELFLANLGPRSRMRATVEVCLAMPWRATLRDDASGNLWPICEICEKPIKDDADHTSEPEDGCDFHLSCVPPEMLSENVDG